MCVETLCALGIGMLFNMSHLIDVLVGPNVTLNALIVSEIFQLISKRKSKDGSMFITTKRHSNELALVLSRHRLYGVLKSLCTTNTFQWVI